MLAWVGFGLATLGLSAAQDRLAGPTPWLVWNVSSSAMLGLWRIHPGMGVAVGDMALVRTPDGVRQFAANRHYVPAGVPLLKRVAATDGALRASGSTRAEPVVPGAHHLRPLLAKLAICFRKVGDGKLFQK
ncbi:S24/S26 family peptidase [Sphingomonas abietis]|uniref:S26 family signal peptidase n=1 Tax=Sphingomonas abietis TaxID=3012344 RepID=A0ABY7NSD5_9SPHN|nr:hypothetical protein [Sphingomonas abietis]WBO24415.1 hypothetical protein PBT88_10080 [Sphingomonas abietis]